MKKILSTVLAAVMLSASIVSCAPAPDQIDPAITLASSDAQTKAEWLDNRLDEIPDHVVMGIGSNETYGIDMTNFDSTGYIARAIDGDILLFGASADGLDRAAREYAKAVDAGTVAELDTVYGEGAWIESLTIAGHDISEFTVVYTYEEEVVMPGNAGFTKGNAKHAATQLVRLIGQATGVTLPMQAESVDGPMFKFDYITDVEPTDHDHSFNYEVKDGNVYINGMARSNGCAMGVYFFLENECGWEGLVYGDTLIHEADSVAVPDGASCAMDPAVDYFNRYSLNGNLMYQTARTDFSYQGIYPKAWHGMYIVLGREHRESEVCYTSEETFEIAYGNIKKTFESYVAAGRNLYEMSYSLATDDSDAVCLCKECVKVFRIEGDANIGAAVRFANRVDAAMDELGFVGIKYVMYAYTGFNKPPKVTIPSEDIQITYCTDFTNCYAHPADASGCASHVSNSGFNGEEVQTKPNAMYVDWLVKWCEISSYVVLYDYVLHNYFHEYTGIQYIYENIQWYKEIGLEGFAPESSYNGLGLGRLRFQLWYTAIWYHDVTEEEYNILVDEIMRNEYGDGWDFVKDYIGIWQETERNLGCLSCYDFSSMYKDDQVNVPLYIERSEEMYQLLERALKLTNTELQEKNVERLLMQLIGNQCYFTYFDVYERDDTERMAVLEERWSLIETYARHSGMYSWLFVSYSWPQERCLSSDLHEEAWSHWSQSKNYYGEGVATREPPDWVTATESET